MYAGTPELNRVSFLLHQTLAARTAATCFRSSVLVAFSGWREEFSSHTWKKYAGLERRPITEFEGACVLANSIQARFDHTGDLLQDLASWPCLVPEETSAHVWDAGVRAQRSKTCIPFRGPAGDQTAEELPDAVPYQPSFMHVIPEPGISNTALFS